MYIIGNPETSSHVSMWAQVIHMFRRGNNVGPSLPLCCPQHSDTIIEVTTPDDFALKAPQGGCSLQCGERIDCGHVCTYKCHSPRLADALPCLTACEKRHQLCDHPCPKTCGEPCGVCIVPIETTVLPCGHTRDSLPCHISQKPELVRCTARIEVIGECGHTTRVQCGTDPHDPKFRCEAVCGANLPCGHQSLKTCSTCRVKVKEAEDREPNVRVDHRQCTNLCGRNFTTCPHACQAACHGSNPCPLCTVSCSIRCCHSKCGKACHEPCAPCALPCNAGCIHQGSCHMPCGVPCDIVPCSRRCENLLECTHCCPSLCGEECPSVAFCQICASSNVKTSEVDLFEGLTYADIDLNENPCIIPDCGHILTLESMDGHMDIAAHYSISEGKIQAPLDPPPRPLTIDSRAAQSVDHPYAASTAIIA